MKTQAKIIKSIRKKMPPQTIKYRDKTKYCRKRKLEMSE